MQSYVDSSAWQFRGVLLEAWHAVPWMQGQKLTGGVSVFIDTTPVPWGKAAPELLKYAR